MRMAIDHCWSLEKAMSQSKFGSAHPTTKGHWKLTLPLPGQGNYQCDHWCKQLWSNASFPCLPIPLDAGSHIADHLIVILIGFPEQSKVSDFCKIKTICIKIANGNPYQPIMFLLRRKCILSLALLWMLGKQLCANALFKVVQIPSLSFLPLKLFFGLLLWR